MSEQEPPAPEDQDQGPGPLPPLPRPWQVSVASVLWIILGVIMVVGSVGSFVTRGSSPGVGPYQGSAGTPFVGVFALFLGVLGVVMIMLAVATRRGNNGARIAVTVIGGFVLIGCWPVVLVAPAIVLQFLSPANAWFTATAAQRQAMTGPMPPPAEPPSGPR